MLPMLPPRPLPRLRLRLLRLLWQQAGYQRALAHLVTAHRTRKRVAQLKLAHKLKQLWVKGPFEFAP